MSEFLQWLAIAALAAVCIVQQWEIKSLMDFIEQDTNNLKDLLGVVKDIVNVVKKVNDRIG